MHLIYEEFKERFTSEIFQSFRNLMKPSEAVGEF